MDRGGIMRDSALPSSLTPFAMPVGASGYAPSFTGRITGPSHDTFSRSGEPHADSEVAPAHEGFFRRQWNKVKTIVSDAFGLPGLLWAHGHHAGEDAPLSQNPFMAQLPRYRQSSPQNNPFLRPLWEKGIINTPY